MRAGLFLQRAGAVVAWVLAVAMVALSVRGASAEGGRVTIIADRGVPLPGDTSIQAIADGAVLRAFLQEHPNYEVKPFSGPKIEGSTFASSLAVATGMAPQVIYVNFRMSSSFISRGFLSPMEVLLARVLSRNALEREADGDGKWRRDPTAAEVAEALKLLLERVPKPAIPAIYRDDDRGDSAEKHVWALPTSTVTIALLYRKDLFAEAGLDPDRPPRTWDEVREYARKLTVPKRNQKGIGLPAGVSSGWVAHTFIASNHGQTVKRDASGKWEAAWGSRRAAEAIYQLWLLGHEPFVKDGETVDGVAYLGGDEITDMFDQGRLGMTIGYLSDDLISTLNPALVGLAPFPGPTKDVRGSELNCTMLAVYAAATPEQQIAGMRYVWFETGEEAKRLRTKIMVENGYGPFVSPVLLKEFGYDRMLRQVPKGIEETLESALASGEPEPYGKDTENIYQYLSDPVDRIMDMKFAGMPKQEAINRIQNIMEASAKDANFRIFGEISPAKLRQMHIVAWIVLSLVALAFVSGAVRMWRYFGRTAVETTEAWTKTRAAWTWGLLLPAILITLGWAYIPLVWGGVLSLTDFQLVLKSTYVGVDNFAHVLYDQDFWASMARTLFYVGLTVGLGFWPPILLAILLSEVPTEPLKYIYRTIYYLPAVISGVILMFLWKELYDPSKQGVLNQLLLSLNVLGPVVATIVKVIIAAVWLSLIGFLVRLPIRMSEMSRLMKGVLWLAAAALIFVTLWPFLTGDLTVWGLAGRFHLEPLKWIYSPQTAMFCVVLPMVWAGAGPGCLLYLAALKTIPNELYEAAEIDGCGVWHKICYITLPKLKFLIGIQFIAALVGAFKGGTDFILAMTAGGPSQSTMIVALDIFIRTFTEMQYGIGAAMAWILGALLVGLTAYQIKMVSKAEFSTAR